MNKIKEKIIHWLGGLTEDEHNNIHALSLQALTHLNEENKRLQKSLRALEHAVEDSRATGRVNFVRVEKPINTFSIESLIAENPIQTVEEQIVQAKRLMSEDFITALLKNNLIDFQVRDDGVNKVLRGTIYVREP